MRELWNRGKWLLLVGALVVGGGVAWSVYRGQPLPEHPLSWAPAGAQVVASVDVPALLDSHLWRVVLAQDDDGEVRRVEQTCGFDPLDGVTRAVVFATGRQSTPFEHIGFVANGPVASGAVARQRLVECVDSVVSGDGARVLRVEVEGVPAIASAHGRSQAAFVGPDGIVGGDSAVVGATIRALDGGAAAGGDPTLRALWDRVSAGRDVVVVARLPARWEDSLTQLGRSLGSSLTSLGAVRTIGVGLRLRDGVALGAALGVERSRDARRLERAVQEQIDGVLEDPRARLSVLGTVLRAVEVEADGDELVLTASASEAQMDALVELWATLRADDSAEESNGEPEREAAGSEDPEPENADPRDAESESAEPGRRAVESGEGGPARDAEDAPPPEPAGGT